MNFMCRIGLHKWRSLGTVGIVMQWQVQECQRSRCGREIGWTWTIHYTPEQMRADVLLRRMIQKVEADSISTHKDG